MEKYTGVFEKFATFDNLYDGYLMARRSKRTKTGVLQYSENLEENIINDVNRLIWHEYKTGKPVPFYEYYPKLRLIHALPFADRVINCAAYKQLWPIYSKSFYEHSYGSIPGKGTVKAVEKMQEWMRICGAKNGDWYVGKADVAKFFFRIPIEVQLRELGRPLDDPDMMWFLETAIRCDGRPFGLPLDAVDLTHAEMISGIGMHVGSLISQITSNVVMSPLDHFIKRDLRVPFYLRYADDMIIFCPSKRETWEALDSIDAFLQNNLGLQLNQKTAVIPVGNKVEFVGRKVSPQKIELRRQTSLQMKRHLRFIMEHYCSGELSFDYCNRSVMSYLGLLKHCTSDQLTEKVLQTFVLTHDEDIMKEYASCL
jgi:RNA-directed DNA polymerase